MPAWYQTDVRLCWYRCAEHGYSAFVSRERDGSAFVRTVGLRPTDSKGEAELRVVIDRMLWNPP